MAQRDFYNIKGLGEIQEDTPTSAPVNHPQRPSRETTGKPTHRRLRTAAFVVTGLVLVGIVITAGYLVFKPHPAPKAASTGNHSPQAAVVTTSGTSQYVSKGSDLNLTFAYPSSWTATPPSGGNTNDQTITLTSPLSTLPAVDGSSTTGKIVVSIRPGSATISELNSNSPTEALASSQIAYTHPTANQYQYPYLSFVHFTGTAGASNTFSEAIITGTTSFSAGEALSPGLLTGLDPIITAQFYKCVTTACSGSDATPLAVTSNTWQNGSIFQQVQAIFASMQLS